MVIDGPLHILSYLCWSKNQEDRQLGTTF